MADLPVQQTQSPTDLEADPAQDQPQDELPPGDGAEQGLSPEEQPAEEEPVEPDDYAGPSEDQVVGDQRTVQLFCQGRGFDGVMTPLGEAWQDDDGEMHGSGLPAVMLFEPSSRQRYRSASLGLDVSPLTVLAKRLSRSTLLRTVIVDSEDE